MLQQMLCRNPPGEICAKPNGYRSEKEFGMWECANCGRTSEVAYDCEDRLGEFNICTECADDTTIDEITAKVKLFRRENGKVICSSCGEEYFQTAIDTDCSHCGAENTDHQYPPRLVW